MDEDGDRKAAVLITRDGYLSATYLDVRQHTIEVTVESLDPSRKGHVLTFHRQGPAGIHVSLYVEEALTTTGAG